MSAPHSDTATTAEATSDAVLTPVGGSGDPALPDADAASVDAVVEPVDIDEDDQDDESGEGLLVREGDVAGDYLERLLDILDVDGDIDPDVEGDRASVAVVGGELKTLIGPDGATLEAL